MSSEYNVPDWTRKFARFGYAAKGLVYGLIGWLAILAAMGLGGDTTGTSGAMSSLTQNTLGKVLLIGLAAGLLCYSGWKFLSAFQDAEKEGGDTQGIVSRIGHFFNAAAHLGLGWIAVRIFMLGGSSSQEDEKPEEMAAQVMDFPFGTWALIAVAIVIALLGLYQFYKLFSGGLKSEFQLKGIASKHEGWVRGIIYSGLISRAVVFLIIAFYLTKAGLEAQASEVKGTGETLAMIGQFPWLLIVVAVGIICYGLYCFILAIYGRVGEGC